MDQRSEFREAITLVKTQYCRHLDTQQWEDFSDVLSEDICMQMGNTLKGARQGRDTAVNELKKDLLGAKTVHQVHNGEFTFNDDGSVEVIWPMQDIVESNMYLLRGFGFYKESYVLENGKWRIRHWRLLRTRLDFKPKRLGLRLMILINSIGALKWIAPDLSLKMTQSMSAGFDIQELLGPQGEI